MVEFLPGHPKTGNSDLSIFTLNRELGTWTGAKALQVRGAHETELPSDRRQHSRNSLATTCESYFSWLAAKPVLSATCLKHLLAKLY